MSNDPHPKILVLPPSPLCDEIMSARAIETLESLGAVEWNRTGRILTRDEVWERIRGWYLGLAGQPARLGAQRARRLGQDSGVLVREVSGQGPAAAAGLREGGLIASLDGKPSPDIDAVHRIPTQQAVGECRSIAVLRGGRLIKATIVPVDRQPQMGRGARPTLPRTAVSLLSPLSGPPRGRFPL